MHHDEEFQYNLYTWLSGLLWHINNPTIRLRTERALDGPRVISIRSTLSMP